MYIIFSCQLENQKQSTKILLLLFIPNSGQCYQKIQVNIRTVHNAVLTKRRNDLKRSTRSKKQPETTYNNQETT